MIGPPLLSLPVEITQHTIVACHPNDVASMAKSCRHLRSIIYSAGDTHIWRSLFLTLFDDPRLRMACLMLGHTATQQEIETIAQKLSYGWMQELQRRIKAMNFIKRRHKALNATSEQRQEILETFISVVETSMPKLPQTAPSALEPPESKSLTWLYAILDAADALNHTVWPSLRNTILATTSQYPSRAEINVRSKLHTYLGLTYADRMSESNNSSTSSSFAQSSLLNSSTFINHSTGSPGDSDRYAVHSFAPSDYSENSNLSSLDLSLPIPRYPPHQSLRTAARAFVYDIRNYTETNLYGPFRGLGPFQTLGSRASPKWVVNWRHVEALMLVVAWNVEEELGPELMLIYGRSVISLPMGLEAVRPWSAPGYRPEPPLSESEDRSDFKDRDWAGVEGRWERAVCFMDYRDFFHFNFTSNSESDLPTDIFEEQSFAEAMRLLAMQLRITHIEDSGPTISGNSSGPGERPLPFGHRPRIYFEGTSEGGTPNESTLRGFVESSSDTGDIRWRIVSRYGGEERWASEGVQVGGVGSKMGVVGCWTGVHHAEGDPAGPFWMWKVE